MNQIRRAIWVTVFSIVLFMGSAVFVNAAEVNYIDEGTIEQTDFHGKTVILQSNDVHGNISGYQYIAGLKDKLETLGADVFLVDCGDYMQGAAEVSYNKGQSAIDMMKTVGYDVVTLGNHEFDYSYPVLQERMKDVSFNVLCDDVLVEETGEAIFDRSCTVENDGVKIGFFGASTPDTKSNTRGENIKGLTFLDSRTTPKIFERTAEDVQLLKQDEVDIVIGLTHLGIDEASSPHMSSDFWAAVKGTESQPDLLLDGHSHSIMTQGEQGEPIMSTGTQFKNIGVVIIDEKERKIENRALYQIGDQSWSNKAVKEKAEQIKEEMEKEYGKTIGESRVELNGYKTIVEVKEAGADYTNGVRDGETNLGDLTADAFRWYALKGGHSYDVPEDHIVAFINGAAIRSCITPGNITRMDLLQVFPFANSVEGVYVTGQQLLEMMETATQSTPEPMLGFPHTMAGFSYTVDTRYDYYPRETTYPNSRVYGPKQIRRVTIQEINGKPFSAEDTYLVVATNFCTEGGDACAVFAGAKRISIGVVEQEVLSDYITEKLGGVINETYKDPAGRVKIIPREGEALKTENPMIVKAKIKKVRVKVLKKKQRTVQPLNVTLAEGSVTYKKLSGSKRLSVSKKTGKVTIRKGTAKGIYKVKVQVNASGNQYCEAKTVSVTAKVRVR